MSYQGISSLPFILQECSSPTGESCGSVNLDEYFVTLLRLKVGREADTVLSLGRAWEALRYFRLYVLHHFNPYDPGCKFEYRILLPVVPDIP
jgi:hypothetical protein